jgi:hypothetical protein
VPAASPLQRPRLQPMRRQQPRHLHCVQRWHRLLP